MIDELIRAHELISDQVDTRELKVVLRQLLLALERTSSGAIVEFGCYSGTTSLFISRILKTVSPERVFHVYDSFEGLPEKGVVDISPLGVEFRAGELAASKKLFLQHYKKAHLEPPIIHKAWFNDLTAQDVPEEVAFAFLDGDYYESIITPLELLGDRLVPGAIVVVDDYGNQALPGAKAAVDVWQNAHPGRMRVEASLAILS